jgi:hypothetical protein
MSQNAPDSALQPVGANPGGSIPGVPPSPQDLFDIRGLQPAEAATRLFLADIERRARLAAHEAQQEASALRTRETLSFGTSIGTGVLTAILVVAGGVLVVFHYTEFAALSEIVGLLSGVGTVAFRQAARSIAQRRFEVSQRETEEAHVLRAIGVTLMIPDDEERNRAMAALAARLTETVGSSGGK